MKTFIKILLMLLGTTALLQAGSFSKDIQNNGVKIHITTAKPLSTGKNSFKIFLLKNGEAVTDSELSFKAFMPAMPGMPAMESLADAKNLGKGEYETTLNFAMSGTWQIHIFITPKEGKKSRAKTSLSF